MAFRLPAHLGRFALRTRSRRDGRVARLDADELRALLYHSGDPGGRDGAPCEADEALPALSLVAKLLRPFAGESAEVAAERLIARFGSLGRALTASPEQLVAALDGDHDLAAAIVAARALAEAGLREQMSHSPVSVRDPDFQRYLRFVIGKSPTECLHATFVTHDWGYLADDKLADGTSGQVAANLRKLLGRAFDVGAHGIILAHNHPSSAAEPSAADIALTRRIAALTGSVDIRLLDHLIVGRGEIVSMRERGFL